MNETPISNLGNPLAAHVLPRGPMDAKIVFIGEAPGKTEVEKGYPFAGLAGKLLNGALEEVGVTRDACYITNVMRVRPAGNKFDNFYHKVKGKKEPTPELVEGRARLRNELLAVRPNVIVPMGNEALYAVTGKKGIMDWRGSVLPSPYGKVVPTVHPALVLRKWQYRPAFVSDLDKVVKESRYPDIRRTKRECVVLEGDINRALGELERIRKEAEYVAFDIETESDQITCVGFADRRDRAICIPFWFGGSGSLWSEDEEGRLWEAIRGLLESETPKKIAHNGMYDCEVLRRSLCIYPRLSFDTMVASHCLYLELPKSLAFWTSLYTDKEYYKYMIKTDSMDTYFEYNATDCMVTYEIAQVLRDELRAQGLEGFYEKCMHALIEPLLAVQEKGVRFDCEARNRLKREYRDTLSRLQEELNGLVGHELNVGSHKQMCDWLYKELKLPKQYKTNKATGLRGLTADSDALKTLAKGTDNKALDTVLAIRDKRKILTTYLEVKLDEDKRIRCSYNLTGTETGRLSSSTTVRGTGTNLQNIPEGNIRRLFVADEGHTFVNGDLSQAEARVVAYLADETRLIEVFDSGGDIHRRNAANIYGVKEEEVTSEQRQLAKRATHAANYGMGPNTFAKTAGISTAESRRLLNQYFATYPRIRLWQMRIRDTIQRTRVLVTPFARKRVFYNRWGEAVVKEALAYIPQSTVADIVNLGLARIHEQITSMGLPYNVLLQVHDSLLVQCPDLEVSLCADMLKDALSKPVEINGKMLVIPVDIKVGKSWGDLH